MERCLLKGTPKANQSGGGRQAMAIQGAYVVKVKTLHFIPSVKRSQGRQRGR